MITFLGDIALISNHMESAYKPVSPYVFNLEYVTSEEKGELMPAKGKINLFSTNNQFENIFGANPIAVNVVNNHIYDFGEKGFENTISTITGKGILCITDKPVFLNENLCLLSFMDLSNNRYFQFDYDAVQKTLLAIKSKNTKARIVVQLHWGIENHPCETKEQQTIAHWLIDNGVDLIIGHHPHCLQPVEEYKGKMIFYSLGNALFGDINTPSHYNENQTASRIYRFRWQKWNRESLAVVYDEETNRVVRIDSLYQKGNKLICKKENIENKMLGCKNKRIGNLLYQFRKYYLFVISNMFVDGKIFDFTALKHELRR